MSEKIRLQLRFSGRVQGVGFRYTAQYTASAYGITGWVLNDYDGSVLMEAQGNPGSIEKMIKRIGEETFIQIDNIEKTVLPLCEYETSFKIRG